MTVKYIKIITSQGGLSNLRGKQSGTHSQKKEFRTLLKRRRAISSVRIIFGQNLRV